MPQERLQKVLARAGVASRRKSEDLIREGRVTVNGRKASLGLKVASGIDEIRLDGEIILQPNRMTYILMNKPRGVLSSRKSQGGFPTVIDLLAIDERVYPVGRLDLDSQGLVLLTNDGALTHFLTHPSFGQDKEYRVLLDHFPDEKQMKTWRKGVVLPDGSKSLPVRMVREMGSGKIAWFRLTMHQGRKRQIRETARALGLQVRKLVRIRMGSLKLGNLQEGNWRHLEAEEIIDLRRNMERRKMRKP